MAPPYFRHHSPSLSIVMSLNVAKCWPAVAPWALMRGGLGALRRGLGVVYRMSSHFAFAFATG